MPFITQNFTDLPRSISSNAQQPRFCGLKHIFDSLTLMHRVRAKEHLAEIRYSDVLGEPLHAYAAEFYHQFDGSSITERFGISLFKGNILRTTRDRTAGVFILGGNTTCLEQWYALHAIAHSADANPARAYASKTQRWLHKPLVELLLSEKCRREKSCICTYALSSEYYLNWTHPVILRVNCSSPSYCIQSSLQIQPS